MLPHGGTQIGWDRRNHQCLGFGLVRHHPRPVPIACW
jgi:hypothetical protein